MPAPRLRAWLRSTAALVAIATLAMAGAFLSQRHYWQLDLTAGARNSITDASRALLEQLNEPVTLEAYVGTAGNARSALRSLVDRFRRHKPDIELTLIDPATAPDAVRDKDISSGGELFVRYQGREQRLRHVSEASLTSALQRLARGGDRWVVFLDGHGERDPWGDANHALGRFGRRLQQAGLQLHQQSLALMPAIPDNTSVLVIASPRSEFLPGEVALVLNYVRAGGNLMWLLEPNQMAGLIPLAQELGVRLLPGVVADPNARQLRLARLDFALAADFAAAHPVTRGFRNMCLLPRSAGLTAAADAGWEVTALLKSNAQSWMELGEIESGSFDPAAGDLAGPLDLVLALGRRTARGEQRVIVAGDGDFLSNAYLDNGGNLEIGLKLVTWLSGDDAFVEVQRQPALDVQVEMSLPALAAFAALFLVVLPLAMLASGWLVWRHRRRR